MGDTAPTIAALVLEGRFEEALQLVSSEQPEGNASSSPRNRLEYAELFERTGRLHEARDLLTSIRKGDQLTDVEQVRCWLLDGLLAKHFGHLAESARAFRRACRLAEESNSLELLCWSQLRLLGVSGDVEGPGAIRSLRGDLRRNTERAAIASVSIAYHVFTAEYEAKCGQLATSRHHSDLAESLLARHPNVWLRGLLDLQQSCLSYLEGDFSAALDAARRALGTSGQSGHVLTRLISLADMAAAYLAIGQPARAEVCLNSALGRARAEEQVFGLLLETLAEAQLVSRDFSGCAASLQRARQIATTLAQSRSSWHRAWNLRTEARLLQRSGKWRESLQLVLDAGRDGRTEPSSFTTSQTDVLAALALTRIGPTREAARSVLGLFGQPIEPWRLFQGLPAIAAASLLEVSRARKKTLSYFARTLRILGATGEASSLVEIVDQFIRVMADVSDQPCQLSISGSTGPLWRPTQIICHLDTCSSVLPSRRANDGDFAAFVESLPDLRAEPRALGEETLRALAGLDWIRSGVVRQYSAAGITTVVASYEGATGADALGRGEAWEETPVRVSLGTRQRRRYELQVVPRDSCASTIHCGGMARLIAALLNLTSRDEQEKVQMASADEPENVDDESGLFRSRAMIALLASARRVAPINITILLTGESGTGKEVIANIIHRAAGIASGPLIPFNCATVPRDMLDSQLFGYRRGAFTGAGQSFEGVFRAAAGGTLLLDEIGELPLETQPKLLRFLDSGEIQPLGEAAPQRVAVRVIAATNADLERMVEQGRFREDLYYRINVVHFHVPPLRERRDEIGPLAARFLAKYADEFGKCDIRLSDDSMEHLLLYHWPGNVRQLSHEMRRLAALHESGSVIKASDLRSEIVCKVPAPPQPANGEARSICLRVDRPLADITRDIEVAALSFAINATRGRMDLAARRLGLSRKGLYLKRQRLGLTG